MIKIFVSFWLLIVQTSRWIVPLKLILVSRFLFLIHYKVFLKFPNTFKTIGVVGSGPGSGVRTRKNHSGFTTQTLTVTAYCIIVCIVLYCIVLYCIVLYVLYVVIVRLYTSRRKNSGNVQYNVQYCTS